MAFIQTLYSGSSGNSVYIGDKDGGLLVDCGKSYKTTCEALLHIGVDPAGVKGVLITHEHSDHIGGIRPFLNKHRVPLITSAGTYAAMLSKGVLWDHTQFIQVEDEEELSYSDFTIRPFATSHDAAQSFGYRITCPDKKVLSVCTDLGVMTPEIFAGLEGSHALVLESNYDEEMLLTGPYPEMLKYRILSHMGHLSNDSCAETLVNLALNGTEHFILGHLSEENNHPEVAFRTSNSLMLKYSIGLHDCEVEVAPRNSPGRRVEV